MIVNQNVNTSNLLLVRSGTMQNASAASKDETDATVFSAVLANTSDKVKTDTSKNSAVDSIKTKDVSDKSGNASTKDVKDTSSKKAVNEKDNSDKKQPDEIKDVEDKDLNEVAADGVSVSETEEENISVELDSGISDEELNDLAAVLSDIFTLIMNQFHISPEEVTNSLESMGMDVQDLLSQNGMKEFFMNYLSVEPTDLLTNENLNLDFQNFMEEWNQILEQTDISVEDVLGTLENMDVDNLTVLVTSELTITEVPVVELQDDPKNVKGTIVNNDEPEVIVTSQTGNEPIPVSSSGDSKSESQQNTSSQDSAEWRSPESYESSFTDAKDFSNPILQNIQDALNNVEAIAKPDEAVQPQQVVEQIVEQVKVHMNQNATSMELQLYPEHLGKIQIHVISKDGVMTARIAAETEQAKQAIENGLANLKEAFEHQELKVEAVEVMVSTTGFQRGDEQQHMQEQNKAGSKSRKLSFSDIEEETEDDDAEQERMRAAGSSVSYTA